MRQNKTNRNLTLTTFHHRFNVRIRLILFWLFYMVVNVQHKIKIEHFLHRIIIQSYIFQPDCVNVLVGEHSTNTKNNLCTRWHNDTEKIISFTIVYSTDYSDADQRKHQSSASLAFVRGIHRDRWIPRTKGQWRGKCFHLMTSSWLLALCGSNHKGPVKGSFDMFFF